MAASQQPSSAQGSNTCTEPPWSGWIETTGDALLILEAARRGLIPRVTRRLVDSERKMITSGSVFVFDEDESGIKRWTDGFFWSPSRILGNFLLYRETDKRGAGHRSLRSDPDTNEQSYYNIDGDNPDGQTLSRSKAEGGQTVVDRNRERTLMGSLTNSYKFRPGGLMKKTFSLTINGVSQHLISYYRIEDVEGGRLRSPSSLPELVSLDISPEYLDKAHFRNPPKVEIGVDGRPRYRGEAEDVDSSPDIPPAVLCSGLPVLERSSDETEQLAPSKRAKRYEPYSGSANSSKRSRKNAKSATSSESTAPPTAPADSALADQLTQQRQQDVGQVTLSPSQRHPHGYPDPAIAVMHAHGPPPPPFAPYAGYYQMPPYAMGPPVMYPTNAYPAPAPGAPPVTTAIAPSAGGSPTTNGQTAGTTSGNGGTASATVAVAVAPAQQTRFVSHNPPSENARQSAGVTPQAAASATPATTYYSYYHPPHIQYNHQMHPFTAQYGAQYGAQYNPQMYYPGMSMWGYAGYVPPHAQGVPVTNVNGTGSTSGGQIPAAVSGATNGGKIEISKGEEKAVAVDEAA